MNERLSAAKPSLFTKIINLIHDIWPRADETQSYRALSRFQLKAEDMIDGPLPDDVVTAAALCEEALKIARRRLQTAGKIAASEDTMRDIEAFAKLTPEEVTEIKNLLEVFLSVTKDRNSLRYQLTDFDRGLNVMEKLEADAETAIPKIQESEKMQRILKKDVGYIEGEKTDLEYEREMLLTGLDFTDKLSIAAVVGLTAALLILGYIAIVLGNPVFFPSAALAVAALAVLATIYLFRRRIGFELKLNAKKQARAVELLNTKVAVLAHHTNFLNYAYKKYRVRNSQGLKRNLSEYDKYKHVTSRLDAIRDIMYETEHRIEQFLREKRIDSGRFSIEQFARNIDIENKQMHYKELETARARNEALLQELDDRHEDIWEQLEALKAADRTASSEDKGVVDAMMQLYMEETALLMNREPGAEQESSPRNEETHTNGGTHTDEEGIG